MTMKLALTNRFFFVSLSCEDPVVTGVPSGSRSFY
jgi:hypothetical protein